MTDQPDPLAPLRALVARWSTGRTGNESMSLPRRNDAKELQAALPALEAEIGIVRMRLAACSSAARSNTPERVAGRIEPDHPCYSASYHDICMVVDREMVLTEAVERIAAHDGERFFVGADGLPANRQPSPQEIAADALRALREERADD